MRIVMVEDNALLEEVSVVGYGTTRNSSLTGNLKNVVLQNRWHFLLGKLLHEHLRNLYAPIKVHLAMHEKQEKFRFRETV